MWSISLNRPLGSALTRRITVFVLAIIMVFSAIATLLQATAHAQLTTEDIETQARWASNGTDIDYNGWPLRRASADPTNIVQIPALFSETVCSGSSNVYYSSSGAPENPSSEDEGKDIIVVICLDLEAEITDQDKESELGGQIILFRGDRGSTDYDSFRPSYPVRVTVLPIEDTPESTPTTTCSSDYTRGIGWLICPVSNFLAYSMDRLYEALEGFLVVQPLTTDRSGVLYLMWDIIRNIANTLFIVGFLFIIYSQITNVGISSYGVKRLLPRLVIAAVLVNISYWISALAVDLSNLLGKSLQDLFMSVGEQVKETGETTEVPFGNWESLTTTVLAGTAAGGAAAVGVVASAGASLWFLLVGIVGVMVSALVALLVLAARQALITILVILSPLAFVAYLLPSTEKYFDSWRNIFMTMLIMFPIFSVIFGGANLAGMAIIYSASPASNNYYNVIILGMIVQIAPVIITPMLIKFGGSILGRIAGIVNDPNKGIVDNTRKLAQRRHDMTKNRRMWDLDKNTGEYKSKNPLAAAARWNAMRGIDGDRKLKAWEATAESMYANDSRAADSYRQTELSNRHKSIGDEGVKRDVAREFATKDALRTLDALSRVTKEEAENAENRNKTLYEEIQAKPDMAATTALREVAKRAQQMSYDSKLESDRQANIANQVSDAYHGKMIENEAWREYAGADGISDSGELRAKANAQSKIMSASSERIENYKKGFLYDKISKDAILEKSIGKNVANQEEWEAAIAFVADSKDTDNITKHFQQINLATAPADIRQAFELAYKASSSRPVFASAGKLGEIGQVAPDVSISQQDLMDMWRIDAAKSGKYSTSGLVQNASKEEIAFLIETLKKFKLDNNNITGMEAHQHRALRQSLEQAFQNRNYRTQIGDKEDNLRKLGIEVFGIDDSEFDKWKEIP